MRTKIAGIVILTALLCVSATDWDGVATVDPAGELNGYSVATNAFPRNTVLDITNLETSRRVRVLVVSGLSNSGLLATLSRSTADALEIRGNSVSRIRMTQPPDDIAYSYLRQLGPVSIDGRSPSTVPAATPPVAPTPAPVEPPTVASAPVSVPAEPALGAPPPMSAEPALGAPPPMSAELAAVTPLPAPDPAPAPAILLAATETSSETGGGHTLTELALLPSDERVPESEEIAIAEESLLSPITPPEYEYNFIDAIQPTGGGLAAQPTTEPMVRPMAEPTATPTTAPAVTPAAAASPIFSPFQAPLITQLEANKWYIQIAAYTRSNYVEDEITRIGREYPLAIQNVGSDTSPMFRVLLGPMNQGESGAVLQRIKSIGYKDAFVRHN